MYSSMAAYTHIFHPVCHPVWCVTSALRNVFSSDTIQAVLSRIVTSDCVLKIILIRGFYGAICRKLQVCLLAWKYWKLPRRKLWTALFSTSHPQKHRCRDCSSTPIVDLPQVSSRKTCLLTVLELRKIDCWNRLEKILNVLIASGLGLRSHVIFNNLIQTQIEIAAKEMLVGTLIGYLPPHSLSNHCMFHALVSLPFALKPVKSGSTIFLYNCVWKVPGQVCLNKYRIKIILLITEGIIWTSNVPTLHLSCVLVFVIFTQAATDAWQEHGCVCRWQLAKQRSVDKPIPILLCVNYTPKE